MNFKILFFLVLSFAISIGYGQNMFSKNPVWTYNKQEIKSYTAHGYTNYEVEKDTVINNKTAHIILRKTIRYDGEELEHDSLFVYENDSKVYLWDNDQFKMMYDFGLKTGDTLRSELNNHKCDSITPIIVDSITITNTDGGQTLNIQHISYTSYSYNSEIVDFITESIVENVGDQREFIYTPKCGILDGFAYTGLRCYNNDDNINFKNKWWKNVHPDIDCEEWVYDTETSLEEKSNPLWQVFTDSFGDFVISTNNTDPFSYELYDSSGKKIKIGSGSIKTIIPSNTYTSGMFFLRIFSNSSDMKTYRIINTK